jgi:hypothetical protein
MWQYYTPLTNRIVVRAHMKFLYLLLFVSFGANAASSYVAGGDLRSAMDAYSHAANLRPLRDSGDDELRIWSRDYMGGRIAGLIIFKGGAIKCQATSHYADGTITVDHAKCRPWHKGQATLAALDAISLLDGKDWNCPMLDGGEVYIDGVRSGRRFALRVGNPDACSDPDSKVVLDLLDKAW